MQVYQFKMWNRNFAVDVESGNFFEVDKVSSEAINLLSRYSGEETLWRLSRRFDSKAASLATKNLLVLKKRGMLFSEEKIQRTEIKRKITDLTLNIVNNCNLRCRYCWNMGGSYGRPSLNNKMDSRISYKALDLLVKESAGFRDLVVDFYGGEPLLNFDVIRNTIEYCGKIQREKKINFRFLLATNGTLLDKEAGEFLIENGVDIAVSIDGPQKIHDLQRPFPGRRGSFDAIMKNINSLREKYKRCIVGRATFTPYSTNVIKTFGFLRNLGFDRIEVCESEKAGYGLELKNAFFFSGSSGIKRLKSLYYKLAEFYSREISEGKLTYKNTYFNRFFKQLSRLYHI